MKRLFGIGRSRAGRLGLVAGVVVAALGGLSAPAYAHHAIVSGSRLCEQHHVITRSTVTTGTTSNDDRHGDGDHQRSVVRRRVTRARSGSAARPRRRPYTGSVTERYADRPRHGPPTTTPTRPKFRSRARAAGILDDDVADHHRADHDNDDGQPVRRREREQRGDDPQGHNNPDCETTTTLPADFTTTQHHRGAPRRPRRCRRRLPRFRDHHDGRRDHHDRAPLRLQHDDH